MRSAVPVDDGLIICEFRRGEETERLPARIFPSGQRVQEMRPLDELDRRKRRTGKLGWWWSSTTKDHVGFATAAQARCLICLDADQTISWIVHEPLGLLRGDSRARVDYVVVRPDGPMLVLVPKPGDKFEAAQSLVADFATSVGWSHATLADPSIVVELNLRWLAGFRQSYKCSDELIAPILEHFAEPAPLLPADPTAETSTHFLPTVYHMLWSGRLQVDLEETLHRGSVVRVA